MKTKYKCIYNHELLILATSQTPYASYSEPFTDAQTIGLVEELRGTGVDVLAICPQAWQTNLWKSKIDRRWEELSPEQEEPIFEADVKYANRAYYRMRRYLMEGNDPVGLTVETARKCGIAPFFSYRMNEHHYTNNPEIATHSEFWKERQHLMLEECGSNLDYMIEEVRDHYRSLIFELLENYEVDGFECDFMRFPKYFREGQEVEGAKVMTGFVREIRDKLDELGEKRGKRLSLCVRVPRSPDAALAIGLNVGRWDAEGLIDMVNASSMFRNTQETDIEGFSKVVKNSSLYGEMHFVTQPGKAPSGYWVNVNRLTLPETYRSTALSFLERGADGISLFNFAYTRDHTMSEPRKFLFPGVEPPFHIIPELVSADKLREGSQLIVINPGFEQLPRPIKGQSSEKFRIYVGDVFDKPFVAAVVRIESDSQISYRPFSVSINGHSTRATILNGELFPTMSIEALPDPLDLQCFSLDPASLRPGFNEVVVHNNWVTSGGGGYRGTLNLERIEVALYRTLSEEMRQRLRV